MSLLVGLFLWFFLSCAAGNISAKKGRSGAVSFFGSLFLSPLIGLFVAMIQSPNTPFLEQRKIKNGSAKRCTSCAELIKPKAIICRYCQTEIITLSTIGAMK